MVEARVTCDTLGQGRLLYFAALVESKIYRHISCLSQLDHLLNQLCCTLGQMTLTLPQLMSQKVV